MSVKQEVKRTFTNAGNVKVAWESSEFIVKLGFRQPQYKQWIHSAVIGLCAAWIARKAGKDLV